MATDPTVSLTLRLLGPPRIQAARGDVRIASHKALALLCYLASHPRLPQPRSTVATLLWEDSSERDGRNSLSTALSHLRQTLPLLPIHADADSLTWVVDGSVWVDSHAFQELVAAEESTIAQLEEAASYWRGPFVEGLPVRAGETFEDWLRQERESWQRRYLSVLVRLVSALERGREWSRAIGFAEQALVVDPLQERFHRALMSLYARSGDRASALRQYRACRQVLQNELGTEPDPRTVALAEAISTGRLSTARDEGVTKQPDAPLTPPSGPLVGRHYEQNALQLHLAEVLRGERRLLMVEGEAGIGKSRLLEELLWRAQSGDWGGQRWTTLIGHSYEAGRGLPYQPFVEALGRVLARIDPRALGVSDVWLAEVNRLLPDLAERCPGLPTPPRLDPDQEQRRLLEGLARLVSALPGPVLVALEDLHWADEASLTLLGFLLRHDAERPLLIVATSRPEEREEPQARLLRHLEREGRLAWLRLGPLSAQATVQLVQGMIGAASEPIAQRVYRETEGHPLFAVETVRSLLEGGVLQAARQLDSDRVVIPESIQAVIGSRLARLSPASRDLVNAVAIFRRTVDFEVARRVSGQDELAALDALEALLQAQLLREWREPGFGAGVTPEALSRGQLYGFSHAIIGQVVYEGLSSARRAALHRRALDALEQLGDTLAEPLAYHAVRGQMWERGLMWSTRAAAEATAVSAYAAAVTLFQQALDCLDGLPSSEERRREGIDLRLRLAEVAFYVQPGELGDVLAAAEREAQSLGDRQRLASVWLAQARTFYILGAFGQALPMLQRLLPLAEAAGDDELLARTQSYLGRLLVIRGEHRSGVELIERSRPRLRDRVPPLELAVATGLVATGLALMGELESALRVAKDNVRDAEGSSDPAVDAAAHFYMALVHHTRGDWEEVRQYATRAVERAREAASAIYEYVGLTYLGRAHAFLDDLPAGIQTQELALMLAQQAHTRAILGRTHAWLADLYRRAGRLADAKAQAEQGRAVADEDGNLFESGLCARVLGEVLLDLADLDGAALLLAESRQILLPLEARPELARLDIALVRLARARGDDAAARELLDRACSEFASMGMHWDLAAARAEELVETRPN